MREWLARHNARLLWRHMTSARIAVECFHVGNGIAIVTWFAAGGWDLFTAPSHTIDIVEALADAGSRLGLT